jgi:nicotinate dehydrogenase subunit A
MSKTTTLDVNGGSHKLPSEPDRPLLYVLRDELGLTGAKYGCGEGACGACTVLVGGEAVRSCVTSLSEVAGKRLTTIEGLEDKGELHPVQQAFLDAGAMQCGYCIPGMILGAVALLRKNARPNDGEIVQSMNGHVCRCGTYSRIVTAIKSVAPSPAQRQKPRAAAGSERNRG